MKDELGKISATLELALQTEIKGRAFYLETSQKTADPLTRRIFESLAEQEVDHLEKIKQIYDLLKKKEKWPDEKIGLKSKPSLSTIFDEAVKERYKVQQAAKSDIEAFKLAREFEDKSYNLYNDRATQAVYPGEKSFYKAIATEERAHYLIVVDSLEYLTDPESWLMRKDRAMFDGG